MIEEELKRYIESLLKQGYDLKTIRESLIHAGHDISKVEEVSLVVFELFHRDLIRYMDSKIAEGHSIEDIKKELMKVGHSEKKLIDILNYHKSKRPRMYFSKIGEIINSEKLWVKHYTTAYLITFLIIIISLILISIIVSKNSEPRNEITNMIDGCNALKQLSSDGEYYTSLCLSLVTKNSNVCIETGNWQNCQDAYYLYLYYLQKDKSVCEQISNINIKELCKQIDENACNNYFGYNGYCSSILAVDEKLCAERSANDIIIESCKNNFHMFKAFSEKNSHECNEVSNSIASNMCKTITSG